VGIDPAAIAVGEGVFRIERDRRVIIGNGAIVAAGLGVDAAAL
jgi:hypothetical protein